MPYSNIDKPSKYFNTVTYTGNGSTQSVTGVGFQPDFTWIKGRSFADHHTLNDSVRGVNKQLYSNLAFGEGTATDCLTAFNTDGFSVGSNVIVNQSSSTLVSWNWLGANTTVSNTNGSITSTVSANTTSGFSIVSYTNPASGSPFTVGHGLGVAPKMIIVKTRNVTQTWGVWHTSIGFGNYLRLNATATTASANLITATSSTTFSTYQNHHATSDTLIAYCFADVKGFSKFGGYTGNGSADGTFVYTGFKPAFIVLKITNTYSDNWFIFDNKRDSFNLANIRLIADLNVTETTQEGLDFLSNGFKLRTTSTGTNASGASYIYMAFAENPFVSSKGMPTTAR
jgi:hypothetical protein